eukprot:scaffold284_cov133-Skeletonema_menzelii.AAC.19
MGCDDDVCCVSPHYHIRPPYSGRNNMIEWTNAMSRLELDTCYMGSYNGDIIHSNGRKLWCIPIARTYHIMIWKSHALFQCYSLNDFALLHAADYHRRMSSFGGGENDTRRRLPRNRRGKKLFCEFHSEAIEEKTRSRELACEIVGFEIFQT